MSTVQYQAGVPASVRAYCDKHAERIHSVDFGGTGWRAESWRYMAWLRSGWNCGDDCVHSVIGDTAADLLANLRAIGPCECDSCKEAGQ